MILYEEQDPIFIMIYQEYWSLVIYCYFHSLSLVWFVMRLMRISEKPIWDKWSWLDGLRDQTPISRNNSCIYVSMFSVTDLEIRGGCQSSSCI